MYVRCQGRKERRKAGQRRRTELYGNATYEINKRKGVIDLEARGNEISEGTEETDRGENWLEEL